MCIRDRVENEQRIRQAARNIRRFLSDSAKTMHNVIPIAVSYTHLRAHETEVNLVCRLLLEKAAVAVSPGAGFGEYGEGYVRIALVENEQRIRQAARNIRKFLSESAKTLHNVIPIASKANRSF